MTRRTLRELRGQLDALCLAAAQGDEMDLHLFFILAIGEEGDGTAVGRPVGSGVYLVAISKLLRATRAGWHEPEIAIFLFGFFVAALDGGDGETAGVELSAIAFGLIFGAALRHLQRRSASEVRATAAAPIVEGA